MRWPATRFCHVRVLLDENVPLDLAAELSQHEVSTVVGLGWAGIKNGELFRRAAGNFDAFVTVDRNIEFQQPISRQPFGVIIMHAVTNRIEHVLPLIPQTLQALDGIASGELRKVRG